MIKVNPRARRHEDRGGDPLDGLVNLFDVGIVLAVAFLLAALSSLNLTQSLAKSGLQRPTPKDAITVSPGAVVRTAPTNGPSTAGRGTPIGTVYRTRDGRLIYVLPSGSGSAAPTPSDVPTR